MNEQQSVQKNEERIFTGNMKVFEDRNLVSLEMRVATPGLKWNTKTGRFATNNEKEVEFPFRDILEKPKNEDRLRLHDGDIAMFERAKKHLIVNYPQCLINLCSKASYKESLKQRFNDYCAIPCNDSASKIDFLKHRRSSRKELNLKENSELNDLISGLQDSDIIELDANIRKKGLGLAIYRSLNRENLRRIAAIIFPDNTVAQAKPYTTLVAG